MVCVLLPAAQQMLNNDRAAVLEANGGKVTIGELKMIGPFQVLDVIGYGGMSTVYKALQPDLDRIVAIKVMLPALVADESFRRRFEREARVIASLRHPHI